jgi:hypothetical protein
MGSNLNYSKLLLDTRWQKKRANILQHKKEVKILYPTANTTANYISPNEVGFDLIKKEVFNAYWHINALKGVIPSTELKSLVVGLNKLCIENKLIIVDRGITYGLV